MDGILWSSQATSNYVGGLVFQLIIPLRGGALNTEMFSNLDSPQDYCCDKRTFSSAHYIEGPVYMIKI
jgi:hypothetical protein